MKSFVLLVVWLGASTTQTISVTRLETMAECQAAKQALVTAYAENWFPLRSDEVRCVEVQP
jgi:hypothetical protein